MRIFAIGDVHGQAERLERLLGRLDALDPGAGLIFLGDYIDRGADSRRVFDILLDVRARRPDTVFLMGNHEAILARYAASGDFEELRGLRGLGFQATLDSYPGSAGRRGLSFMPDAHLDFLDSLSRWHQAGAFAFFHAPLAHGLDPDAAGPAELEMLLSNRRFENLGWENHGQTLVFGHVPLKSPLVAPGLIGIDTGAGYGRVLTAVELPDVRFHHA